MPPANDNSDPQTGPNTTPLANMMMLEGTGATTSAINKAHPASPATHFSWSNMKWVFASRNGRRNACATKNRRSIASRSANVKIQNLDMISQACWQSSLFAAASSEDWRREGDSNPRQPFELLTLSRRVL